jgi:hypothetical protein
MSNFRLWELWIHIKYSGDVTLVGLGTLKDKSKHLEFIQNAINRMANNSFIIKGWAVTLVTAIIGFSLSRSITSFVYLAFLPTLIFWGLDAYYLRQERLFRNLYNHAIKRNSKELEPFSLDTDPFKNEVDPWLCTVFSKTLLSLYGIIILVIIAIGIGGGI